MSARRRRNARLGSTRSLQLRLNASTAKKADSPRQVETSIVRTVLMYGLHMPCGMIWISSPFSNLIRRHTFIHATLRTNPHKGFYQFDDEGSSCPSCPVAYWSSSESENCQVLTFPPFLHSCFIHARRRAPISSLPPFPRPPHSRSFTPTYIHVHRRAQRALKGSSPGRGAARGARQETISRRPQRVRA